MQIIFCKPGIIFYLQRKFQKVSQNQNKVLNQNQQMAGFTSINEYGWFSTSGRKSENVQLKNQNVNNKAACITQNLLKVLDNLRHITCVKNIIKFPRKERGSKTQFWKLKKVSGTYIDTDKKNGRLFKIIS